MKPFHRSTLLLIPVGLVCGYIAAASGARAQQEAELPPPPVLHTVRPAPYLNRNMTPWPNQPDKGYHWSIDDIRKAHQTLADAEKAGKTIDPNSTLHDFPFWTRTHSMF